MGGHCAPHQWQGRVSGQGGHWEWNERAGQQRGCEAGGGARLGVMEVKQYLGVGDPRRGRALGGG